MKKWFWQIVSVVAMVCNLNAGEVKPILSVDFTQDAQVAFAGKSYPVTGDGLLTLPGGEKTLKFGEKTALRVPVGSLLDNAGTIVFKFALEPFPPFKDSPMRPMCTIDAGSRMQCYIGTGANVNPPFVQFSFGDAEHSVHYVRDGLSFHKIYAAALSFDGSKLRYYLDGVLIHEVDQPVPGKKGDWRDVIIGAFKDGWVAHGTWQGGTTAKSLKVYDRALSGEAIAQASEVKIATLREKYPQVLTVPAVRGVNGFPAEKAWQNAATVFGMANVDAPEKSWINPENKVQFLYDETNLYLQFRSVIPAGVNIKKGYSAADGEKEVWGFESFELYFANGDDLYRFAGSFDGGMTESKNSDVNFNAKWNYITSNKMQINDTVAWLGQITVPWKSIGFAALPKDGVRFNFARTWRLNDTLIMNTLARPHYNYNDVPGYVKLVPADGQAFLKNMVTNNPAFGILEGKAQVQGSGKYLLRILAGNEKGLIPDEPVWQKELALSKGSAQEVDFHALLQKSGIDALVFSLTDATGKTVFQQQILPVKVEPEYLRLSACFSQEKLEIQYQQKQAEAKFGKNLRLELVAPDGKRIFARQADAETLTVPFAKTNPAGHYQLVLSDGKALCASSVFDFPGFGAWSKSPKQDKIVPPYTPIQVKNSASGKTVCVLGREYQINHNALFLSGMSSLGEAVLQKPIALRVGGRDVAAQAKVRWGKVTPQRVEYTSAVLDAACQVQSSAWIEYDGVAFYTVDFEAKNDVGTIELVFELPREIAKYLHAAHQPWGNKITDVVADGKRAMRYYPVVFLGKENKGFSFFAESRYTWPEKGSQVMQLDANAQTATFAVRLASQLKKGEHFHFEFGCMGTPVKSLPKNYPLNIMGGFPELNRPTGTPSTYVAFGTWRDGQTHGDCLGDLPQMKPQMTFYQKEINRIHQHRAKVFPYAMNLWLSDEYPEVGAFLKEWAVMPMNTLPYEKEGKKYAVHPLCAETQAADYYIWHLREMLKTAKFDAIYFDFGTAPVCNNAAHGCHEKTTVLATRDFLRRVALTLLESGAQEYAIILHNTDIVQAPAMSFATHLFNGEQIRQASSSLLHDGKDILDSYPLTMFASELNSLPFGLTNSDYLPADVLLEKYGGGKEKPELYVLRMTRAMLAGALIHNTIPSMQRSHRGIFDKVVRIYEAFGVPEADFLGYYDKRNPAEVIAGKEVYASSYRSKDRKKLLTVISHVGKAHLDQVVKIKFAPEKAGMSGFTSAVEKMEADDPAYQDLYELRKKFGVPTYRAPLDYVSGGAEIVSWENNVLTMKLKAHTFAIVELQ